MFSTLDLFAGAGGLSLGLERAGFNHVGLNELNKDACNTLRLNRPNWNIIEGDISNINFSQFIGIDLITGGFPCQSFSYAGNGLGFSDDRGRLFFEFIKIIRILRPKVFLLENVKALLKHNKGETLQIIKNEIELSHYNLIECDIYDASYHAVPQKRERLIMIAVSKDLNHNKFIKPAKFKRLNLDSALKKGILFDSDVPISTGKRYKKSKEDVLNLIPQGGYWKSLPLDIQKDYMKKSFYSGGGKTGIARRLSWDEPCLTLTCSPDQTQTERCHPDETRPLTIREYARIQTFPDNWEFFGSITSQYKQIGNAVPVNLGYNLGKSLFQFLKGIYEKLT